MADRQKTAWCSIDGEVSNWESVLSGVPQGSVLRPLLLFFIIVISAIVSPLQGEGHPKLVPFTSVLCRSHPCHVSKLYSFISPSRFFVVPDFENLALIIDVVLSSGLFITDGDKQLLQNDLDKLVKWSEKWQMLFNFGKCKCKGTLI